MQLYRAKDRALIGQLIIDLLKTSYNARSRALRGKGKPHLAAEIESMLLNWSVLIAQVNGKPKNASEIGRYLGIPRVTAQRKLDELESLGVVIRRGGRYYMAELNVGDEYIDRCLSLIKRASKIIQQKTR
jgi:predicted Rossmann fold nucleotide-binding protein DprA/Smf involved in DNA uptake